MLKNFASGDWLYVLLGLVWLGVSVYKSSQKRTEFNVKKKANQPQKQSYFDTLLQSLDNAIGDNIPGQATANVYDEEVPAAFDENVEKNGYDSDDDYETLETAFSYDDMVLQEENKNPFDATKSVFNESLTENLNNYNVKQNGEDREKRVKIDIRKAFIYDVVLNPPSF